MKEQDKFQVLVIDDEKEVIQSFKAAFVDDWEVEGITHPDELRNDLKNNFRNFQFKLFDLIFLDLLFDASTGVTRENVVEKIEKGELLGVQFLDWLAENYPRPVVVLSGFLFNTVVQKLRSTYPWVLLQPKPVDLNVPDFRSNMEWYGRNFHRIKYGLILEKPASETQKKFDELMQKKPC